MQYTVLYKLGLKGQLSELELHTIRARLTAGILNKAERGELALMLPTGFVRDPSGVVCKHPNQEVQTRLMLVFETFLQVRSASKVLRGFNDQMLLLPRSDRFGDIVWRKPTVSAILSILKHPAYAGAFTYGRCQTIRTGPGPEQAKQKRLPIQQWRIVVKDKYPAYISWETYEQIQAMLKDNHAQYDRNKTRGIPRPGKALLHGIVYCGECGHKMVVQYKAGTRYLCNYLRQQYGVPVCQHIPADPVDDTVVNAFFAALSPVELDFYTRAIEADHHQSQTIDQAHQQQLERLHYQVTLAQRQFNQVDPDNRLVAAELERRWEVALRELQQAQTDYERLSQAPTMNQTLSAELKAAFTAIGQTLPDLWQQEVLTQTQKKSLLRCLIDKVVVHRSLRDQLCLRVVWKGDEVTTFDIPIVVGSVSELSNSDELQQRILTLSNEGVEDQVIAKQLTAEGFRSPMNPNCLLPSTVQGVRLKHGVLVKRSQSHPHKVQGHLTISQLARKLDVTPHWIYDRIHNGTIVVDRRPEKNRYLFPDNLQTLRQFKQLKAGKLKSLCFKPHS